jgi:hypothetical protein
MIIVVSICQHVEFARWFQFIITKPWPVHRHATLHAALILNRT